MRDFFAASGILFSLSSGRGADDSLLLISSDGTTCPLIQSRFQHSAALIYYILSLLPAAHFQNQAFSRGIQLEKNLLSFTGKIFGAFPDPAHGCILDRSYQPSTWSAFSAAFFWAPFPPLPSKSLFSPKKKPGFLFLCRKPGFSYPVAGYPGVPHLSGAA